MRVISHEVQVPRPASAPVSSILAADRALVQLVEDALDQGMSPLLIDHEGSQYKVLVQDEHGDRVIFWIDRYPHIMRGHIEKALDTACALCETEPGRKLSEDGDVLRVSCA